MVNYKDLGLVNTKEMFAKAIKGDVKAAQFVRDTIGEVPTQTVNNNNTNANFNIDDASVINEVLNKLKEL